MDGLFTWILKLQNMMTRGVLEQKTGAKIIPEGGSFKGLVVNSNKEEEEGGYKGPEDFEGRRKMILK